MQHISLDNVGLWTIFGGIDRKWYMSPKLIIEFISLIRRKNNGNNTDDKAGPGISENNFNAMVLAQEQTEKVFGSYVEKLPWATEESKKSVEASVEMGKKACADFKKAVDEGYSKFEEMLDKK